MATKVRLEVPNPNPEQNSWAHPQARFKRERLVSGLPVEDSKVQKAPCLLRGLRHQPRNLCCQLSPGQEPKVIPYHCTPSGSSGCIPACYPPSPWTEAGLLFLSQEGGEGGGQGTGWSLLWGFWETAWFPGLKLKRKGGSRVAPVECGAQQPPVPTPHKEHKQSKLQKAWKSLNSRASTPQPLPPSPWELILRLA